MRYLLLMFVCAGLVSAQSQTTAAPAAPAPSQKAATEAPAAPAAQSPAAPAAAAPAPAAQQPLGQPFRIQVNEVIVPITVTGDKGKFVNDLEQKDFHIYDEGQEQSIRFFTRERSQPVVVGFLMDQSNASRLHWPKYQDAAVELVLTLLPGDKKYSGYLVGYAQDAELMVNTTSDPEKLVDRIRKMKAGGGAALYDAIYMACTSRDLVKGEPIEPRRVIVIIGDGHDNASKHNLSQVIELAERNLVTIYCINTVGFGFNAEGDATLQRLAEATGGRVVSPLQNNYTDVSGYLSTPSDEGNYALKVGTGGYAAAIASGIFKSVASVAGEVTMQYLIRYIPNVTESPKGPLAFRHIEVRVDLPNVKVRARRGYYPPSQ